MTIFNFTPYIRIMETLVLQSLSKKDIAMFEELARRAGLKTRLVNKEYVEGLALAGAMDVGRTGEYVDTEAYLTKLRGK